MLSDIFWAELVITKSTHRCRNEKETSVLKCHSMKNMNMNKLLLTAYRMYWK